MHEKNGTKIDEKSLERLSSEELEAVSGGLKLGDIGVQLVGRNHEGWIQVLSTGGR